MDRWAGDRSGSWYALALAIALQALLWLAFGPRPAPRLLDRREPVTVAIVGAWRDAAAVADQRPGRAPQQALKPPKTPPSLPLTPLPSSADVSDVQPQPAGAGQATLRQAESAGAEGRALPTGTQPPANAATNAATNAAAPPLDLRLPADRGDARGHDLPRPSPRAQALTDPRANRPRLSPGERLAQALGEFDCVVDERQPDGTLLRRRGRWGQVTATGAGGIAGALGISARHCVPFGPAVVQP